MTAYITANPAGGTWTKRTLYGGVSGYTTGCPTPDGQIMCGFEKGDVVDSMGEFGSRIGLVKFNLAAALSTTAYDYVLLGFNEGADGNIAWTDSCQFRDLGNMGLHAQVKGVPVFNAGVGCAFSNTDYVVLAEANNSFYDPDHAAGDTGDFTIGFAVKGQSNNAAGYLFASNTGVGSGTAGISVKIDAAGTVTATLDNGTNQAAITSSTTGILHDNNLFYIFVQRHTSNHELTLWIYDHTSEPVEFSQQGDVVGPLSNIANQKCLLRASNSATGRMNNTVSLLMFFFARKALLASQFPALPYVPPAAETFAASNSNAPDQIGTISKLQLWIAGTDGFGGGLDQASRAPATSLTGLTGQPACGWLDRSPNGFFPSAHGTVGQYVADSTYGGAGTSQTPLRSSTTRPAPASSISCSSSTHRGPLPGC